MFGMALHAGHELSRLHTHQALREGLEALDAQVQLVEVGHPGAAGAGPPAHHAHRLVAAPAAEQRLHQLPKFLANTLVLVLSSHYSCCTVLALGEIKQAIGEHHMCCISTHPTRTPKSEASNLCMPIGLVVVNTDFEIPHGCPSRQRVFQAYTGVLRHPGVGVRVAALQQVEQELHELLPVLLDGVVDLQARRE